MSSILKHKGLDEGQLDVTFSCSYAFYHPSDSLSHHFPPGIAMGYSDHRPGWQLIRSYLYFSGAGAVRFWKRRGRRIVLYSRWNPIYSQTGKLADLAMMGILNSLAPGRCVCNLKSVIFKLISRLDALSILLWNCPRVNTTRPHWWFANIGLSNVLWDNKPLSEPVLPICYH